MDLWEEQFRTDRAISYCMRLSLIHVHCHSVAVSGLKTDKNVLSKQIAAIEKEIATAIQKIKVRSWVISLVLKQLYNNSVESSTLLQDDNNLFQACHNYWERAVRTHLVDKLWDFDACSWLLIM